MKEKETRSAAERLLDEALEYTFPASDPIAVDHAFDAAREREETDVNAEPARRRSVTRR